MKQLWIVVLIWYICVNENYLFTRAEYLSSTIPLKREDIQISCNNNSLLLQIWNVTVPQDTRSCENHKCALSGRDDKDIKRRCNGANICKPNVNLTSKCLVKQPIGTYEISYNCKVLCDFERDQCSFDKATNKDTFPKWTRIKANTIGNGAFEDHTTGSGNGSMMYFESHNVPIARLKSPTITLNDSNNNEWICIKFWLISFDPNYMTNVLILYTANNDVIGEYHLASQGVWEHFTREVLIPNGHIIFEAHLRILNGSLGLDDISISLNKCIHTEQTYSHCANWNADLRLNNCPTLFMRRLQIHFTNIDPLSAKQQNCSFSRRIASAVIKHCIQNYTLDYCDINLSKVVSSYNYTCPVPHKSIYLEYVCKVPLQTTSGTPFVESTTQVPLQTTSGTPFVESTTQASIPIIVVSVLVVVIVAALVFIIIVFYRRRKIAKNSNSSENRQKEIKTDNIISYSNNSGMAYINIPEIYENIHDNNTINREEHQQEENYETLSTNRKSDEHMYASTEHESTEPNLSQYQSLTNPSESDIHTYASTERDLSQYTSLTNPVEPDIHTYASTASK